MGRTCHACSAPIETAQAFCRRCGAAAVEPTQALADQTACGACGVPVVSGDVFCRACGQTIAPVKPSPGAAPPPEPALATRAQGLPAYERLASPPLLERLTSFKPARRGMLVAGLALIVLCGA